MFKRGGWGSRLGSNFGKHADYPLRVAPRGNHGVSRPGRLMIEQVLLLTPSKGSGGGIERYAEALEGAFKHQGVEYDRIDLEGSGPIAHVRMLAVARQRLAACRTQVRIVVLHRALLPIASVLGRNGAVVGISLVCHGIDVWGGRSRARGLVEDKLMHGRKVRVVAVSSFTAGALLPQCCATILPPGLSQEWFETLTAASTVARQREGFRVVTVFRLADWKDKGLPELLDAVSSIERDDVEVVVCGSGEVPAGFQELASEYPFCTFRSQLTDQELADELAAADIFVLATRTRSGRNAYGEGFGLVLLEAQVAATVVVGPAFGGSHDAFVDRVTGFSPVDETAPSLAAVLRDLLQDSCRLAEMGKYAAEVMGKRFAPDAYAERVVRSLL